ncbi:MAG: cobalamin-independent methionine synthase II family protein [Candidatus Rokubacteria bacterium]|nr:cobalamin-independent methionine synthase II family protein [Candidatus Rokubacteria bacterium]
MPEALPLLPTTVCGSHGLPSWLFLVREAVQADRLGPTDIQEAYDDAIRIAIRDQVEAGVDVISDGEMRRVTFIRGFYERLTGLKPLPVPRRMGPLNYDSHCPYEVVDRITAPRGLGIVDEFSLARPHADRPMRVAVPGPMTLLMPLRRGGPYQSEESLVADLIAIVRREIQELVAAGAELIQLDEPNYVMAAGKHRVVKGGPGPMVDALNAAVEGVRAKLALHVCFGNAHNNSFATPRRYRPLYPTILEARVDQFVFEYANREMAEIELWSEFPSGKEVAVGVIDVKAFRVETPEEVADRIRQALKHIPAERLWLVPDCGLWETPRWVGVSKLRSMVEGARIVRRELGMGRGEEGRGT